MRLATLFLAGALLSLAGCNCGEPYDPGDDAGVGPWGDAGDPNADPDGDGRPNRTDNCPNAPNADQADKDGDGVGDACDNCLDLKNPDQVDDDRDTLGNACDNCPAVANLAQTDSDRNGRGDECDKPDDDADGAPNGADNCPNVANTDQRDTDRDGRGDACDNCTAVANFDQADSDRDKIGDACESQFADGDGDGAPDAKDNCARTANANQSDVDKDGVGDLCDNCPGIANNDQADANKDGKGDACETTQGTPPGYDLNRDDDKDGRPNRQDNCPALPNPDQLDTDKDGLGDACDNCRLVANNDQKDGNGNCPAPPFAADPRCGDPCDLLPPTTTCGDQTATWSRLKPDVLILLDRSGSMSRGTPTKWSQAVDALDALADGMYSQLRLGLAAFSGAGVCTAPQLRLPLGDHTSAQIKQSYSSLSPSGNTPAALALQTIHAQNWLKDPGDAQDAQRKKAVLMITDGQPNCDPAAQPQDTTPAAAQATVDAAAAIHATGALVFVVGFGSEVTPATLNAIATAGDTDNPNDAANRYYQANNTAELQQALVDIASVMVTCDLALTSKPPAPDRIYVTSNGTQLPRGDPNGFSYDATRNVVTVQGTACDALKSSASPTIVVKFGCAPPPCASNTELCDYGDNNCDGRVDEGCGTPGEICDGFDNDQDGRTDEGCPAQCVPKMENCENWVDDDCDGLVDECGNACPNGRDPEICDGIDNNCDGRQDEGCTTGCVPAAEVCDTRDNDCDGATDEGCPGGGPIN